MLDSGPVWQISGNYVIELDQQVIDAEGYRANVGIILCHQDGRVFWDVRHPEKTVVIKLLGGRYKELIVEVENPESVAAMINDAISKERT